MGDIYQAHASKLRRLNPEAGISEIELILARIAGGSTVMREGERVNVPEAAIFHFVQTDENLNARYKEAIAYRAESLNDKRIDHAVHMLDHAKSYTKEEVAAKREGLKTLGEVTQTDNRERFGTQVTHKHQAVPVDLKEHLAKIEQARRQEAITGPVVDAEFTEVKEC